MKHKCQMVDTTLREGNQSTGIAFSNKEKVELALKLDEIGVQQIEVGISALGDSEYEVITEMMAKKKQIKVAAWSEMNLENIKEAISSGADIIHIGVPVSYSYIYTVLQKNKQWLKKQMTECVSYAMTSSQEITVSFENASRADISFIISLGTVLTELGIKRVRYVDTVGILTPKNVSDIIRNICYYTGLEVEMHCHDDLGMAIANSIVAVKSGAKYIDCTLIGSSRGVGNCDFFKFTRASQGIIDTGIQQKDIYGVQSMLHHFFSRT